MTPLILNYCIWALVQHSVCWKGVVCLVFMLLPIGFRSIRFSRTYIHFSSTKTQQPQMGMVWNLVCSLNTTSCIVYTNFIDVGCQLPALTFGRGICVLWTHSLLSFFLFVFFFFVSWFSIFWIFGVLNDLLNETNKIIVWEREQWQQ